MVFEISFYFIFFVLIFSLLLILFIFIFQDNMLDDDRYINDFDDFI